MKILFDVLHLYYLPQYLPVYRELLKTQAGSATFVLYHSVHDDIIKRIVDEEKLDHIWVNSSREAKDYYLVQKADWVFFANCFDYLAELHTVSQSVQLGHGIGPKTSYYKKSDTATTVRFVEGQYRTERFKKMYPQDTFVNVGFCKLDPIINKEVKPLNLVALGLNPDKKTLLYAPTFYPSSIECFPKNWPQQFNDFNILIKPHYFSLCKDKYIKQRTLLEHWASYENVCLAKVEDYSLIPYMVSADLLISDASSALFEFAVLNKPVVWCDFLKLRWSYRGIFSYRFKKRMDQDYGEYASIAAHAVSYNELKKVVQAQVNAPENMQDVRLAFTEKLAGVVDGKASARIIEYLLSNIKQKP